MASIVGQLPRRGWASNSDDDDDDRKPKTKSQPPKRLPKRRNVATTISASKKASSSSSSANSDSSSDTDSSSSDVENRNNNVNTKGPCRRDSRTKKEILVEVCNALREKKDLKLTWTELAEKVRLTVDRVKEIVMEAILSPSGVSGFQGALREFKGKGKAKAKVGLHCSIGLCVQHVINEFGCSGDRCTDLHLCPNWLFDKCKKDDGSCDLGHGFGDPHNVLAIAHAGMDGVPHGIITHLIAGIMWAPKDPRKADFPHICPFYNSEEGCEFADDACPRLHLCFRTIPELSDGQPCDECHLNHSRYGTNVTALCSAWGIDVDGGDWRAKVLHRLKNVNWDPKVIQETKEKRSRAAAPKVAPQPSADNPIVLTEKMEAQKAEICLDFLHGKCKNKHKCPNGLFHGLLPYQWQILDNRTNNWLNFPSKLNEDLENAFVNENIEKEQLEDVDPKDIGNGFTNFISLLDITDQNPSSDWTADFDSLTLTDSSNSTAFKLRRLTTPTTTNSSDQWATKWKWFFSDKHGNWTEYGADTVEDTNVNYRSSVSSDDLEKAYHDFLVNNGQPSLGFQTSKYAYEIYFNRTTFIQKNMDPKYLTERRVRRRPVAFTSVPSVGQADSKPSNPRSTNFPRRWTGVTSGSTAAALVPVSSGTEEWNELLTFVTKFHFGPFVKAERVQNPVMYQQYAMGKDKLKVAHKAIHGSSRALSERKLLHPIAANHASDVLIRNVDWRNRAQVTYSTGLFGHGSYCYGPGIALPQPSSGQTWVLVDAYVGDVIKGDPQLTCVNPHLGTGKNYECAVDDDANPAIFVFFSFQHVYPQYVLTF